MSEEPLSHAAGIDVPEDARRSVRHLVAGGSDGVGEADGFHHYERLERLELREGTLEVGRKAFYECKTLSRVDSPSSLRRIDDLAFADCSSLSRMNLLEGYRHIGWGAFLGHRFRRITIPSSVAEIGFEAFAEGKFLSEVTLAGGTVLLGRNAFLGCRHLRNVATPSVVIVVEDRECGNGRAEVVTGGTIALDRHGREPTRLILASPYLASMKSADVQRANNAIDRIACAGKIRSRFRGLLSAIARGADGQRRGEGPLDLAAGNAADWIRVCEGADRIRSRFLRLLSAHRRAVASILERAPVWESGGGWVEPGVVEIIMSFLGDVEGR